MKKVLVINGPNLNLLGRREPDIYGTVSLEEINQLLKEYAEKLDCETEFFQSNCEGDLISKIQEADGNTGIILNAGAYSHYSIAIRDAIASIGTPCIEVHMSNIYAREVFRQHSIIAPVCKGQISGFGAKSYLLALIYLLN